MADSIGTGAQVRIPVLYLSHGAPTLADDAQWTDQLSRWSADLPRPRGILIVSAHWEAAPLTISATSTVPLVYDFWGFPQHYYQVSYPAPGAPWLAERVTQLLSTSGQAVHQARERGLDHGAYIPLVEMYPDADIPVLQLSMPTLDPETLLLMGRRLAPLRNEGVLIIGSGFFTHNLHALREAPEADSSPPAWSAEFDQWGQEALSSRDVDALLDFEHKAPSGKLAHPRTEHFAPLFVTLGAGDVDLDHGRTVIDGFWHGLAKRSIQIG
ncbi:MAG TPA: class III extradiol ring-cleavage dioxygenase [Candidatus Dormibacteraeota bacterium]|nr:class III extradiol ring-cleavage dioxygenase [Candidatus Dormibacteraeota bacterium]